MTPIPPMRTKSTPAVKSSVRPISYGLLAAAVVVLALLLILPATGWIAGTQVRMLAGLDGSLSVVISDLGVKNVEFPLDPAAVETARQAAAARAPRDYEVQLAGALWGGKPTGKLTAEAFSMQRLAGVRALGAVFPEHRVAVCAHSLRVASAFVSIHRDSEVEPYNTGRPFKNAGAASYTAPTRGYLAAYDSDAAVGEHLDPDNAYFPLMRAIGLFAARRDAEGVAALLRAGRAPRLEDYTNEEQAGVWKLYQGVTGSKSAAVRACAGAAVLLPHYSRLRSVARFAVYKAACAEAAGQTEQGLAIRHAVMHCADVMRTTSHSAIGSLVGIACAEIMTTRPGAASPIENSRQGEQLREARHSAYDAYLRRIGRSDEATWAQHVLAAGPPTSNIISAGLKNAPVGTRHIAKLLESWTLEMALLANALEILIMGAAMLLLARFGRDRRAAPVLVSLGLLVGFGVLAVAARWPENMSVLGAVIRNLSSDDSAGSAGGPLDATLSSPFVASVGVPVLCLLGPLLLLISLGIVRGTRPEATGSIVAGGLRTAGLGIALLLLLCYAGMVATTAHTEARAHAAMDRLAQNETQALGDYAGKQIPP